MEKGFIISLIFAAIVGVFALSNSEPVTINLIFTELIMSQAIVIFLSAILGAIVVAFLGWVKGLKFKKEIRELNRKVLLIDDEKAKLVELMDKKEEQIKMLYDLNTDLQSKE